MAPIFLVVILACGVGMAFLGLPAVLSGRNGQEIVGAVLFAGGIISIALAVLIGEVYDIAKLARRQDRAEWQAQKAEREATTRAERDAAELRQREAEARERSRLSSSNDDTPLVAGSWTCPDCGTRRPVGSWLCTKCNYRLP